ncbi:MAG: hypothetical protein Q8J64_06400 [Thermodesulfovibrionales bacterium]|nr:hypothetical protein [Thermodesulfovibrionales bacterium]
MMGLRIFLIAIFLTGAVSCYAFDYEGVKTGSKLSSLPKGAFQCAPMRFDPKDQKICTKNNPGKVFGVQPSKVELGYKNDLLYIIFIGFRPADFNTVNASLEQKYGRPTTKKQLLKGVYQYVWQRGETELVLNKDEKRQEADVTMYDYKAGGIKE